MNITYRESEKRDSLTFPCAWYAVAWSRDIAEKPVKRRLLGKDIVLFRSEHRDIYALHAYCPHRGADLSLGSCEDGFLTCAYHAWRFNGQGKCTSIPSQPDRNIPEFAHTKAFPVAEKYGLVWVYPSELKSIHAPLEPPSAFTELEDPSLRLAPYDAIWKAHLTRVIESVLDVAHVPIVHRKTIGKRSSPAVQISFEAYEDTIRIRNGGGLLEYRFPQHWLLTPSQPTDKKFINYVTFTPIDSERTAIFGYAGRNFIKLPAFDAMFSKYSNKVLNEDQSIVESQHPRPIPEALRMEAHVAADGPQVRFRQRWYQFLTDTEPKVLIE